MITKHNNIEQLEYLQPCAEEFSFSPEGVVCESLDGGGLEGTKEDDLNF